MIEKADVRWGNEPIHNAFRNRFELDKKVGQPQH